MNNFLFENKTRFLFGGGCVKEYLASFLTGYGPSVLLVREEGDRRSGAGYSCAGVPLFRRNGYRQSSGRKPLFRNRDTALN